MIMICVARLHDEFLESEARLLSSDTGKFLVRTENLSYAFLLTGVQAYNIRCAFCLSGEKVILPRASSSNYRHA